MVKMIQQGALERTWKYAIIEVKIFPSNCYSRALKKIEDFPLNGGKGGELIAISRIMIQFPSVLTLPTLELKKTPKTYAKIALIRYYFQPPGITFV